MRIREPKKTLRKGQLIPEPRCMKKQQLKQQTASPHVQKSLIMLVIVRGEKQQKSILKQLFEFPTQCVVKERVE